MAGRAVVSIEMTEAERAALASRLHRRKVARGDAIRAEIVLLAADRVSNMVPHAGRSSVLARIGIASASAFDRSAAEHAPVTHSRLAVRERKVTRQAPHLGGGQQERWRGHSGTATTVEVAPRRVTPTDY